MCVAVHVPAAQQLYMATAVHSACKAPIACHLDSKLVTGAQRKHAMYVLHATTGVVLK